ncbi:MAG: DUF6169 family protein [Sphingobacteriales bacterium]
MLYPYPLKETDKLTYQFITDQGITYLVYFLDYSYMFEDYPLIARHVYTFNIDVIDGNINRLMNDERIGLTVVEIIRLFFEALNNVAIYICDSLDNRQLARKRKFDLWFWKYNDGSIIKEDELALIEGVKVYNTLLLHKENEHFDEILEAFKELNARDYNK